MSNPSLDEMDALMGDPGARHSTDETVIEDEGSEERAGAAKKAGTKAAAVRLAAGAAIGLVVLAGGAFYISSLKGPSNAPPPDAILAEALGPDSGAPYVPSEPVPDPVARSVTPASEDAAATDWPDGALGDEQEAYALEDDAPSPARNGATVNIPLEDFTALNSRVEELESELETAVKERDEAKAAPPRTVTRNVPVQTSFLLVDTLVDGAVIRDQSGNEHIVPLRARVRTDGDKLNVEG